MLRKLTGSPPSHARLCRSAADGSSPPLLRSTFGSIRRRPPYAAKPQLRHIDGQVFRLRARDRAATDSADQNTLVFDESLCRIRLLGQADAALIYRGGGLQAARGEPVTSACVDLRPTRF